MSALNKLQLISWRLDSDRELTLEFREINPSVAGWTTARDPHRDTKGLPREVVDAVVAWAVNLKRDTDA